MTPKKKGLKKSGGGKEVQSPDEKVAPVLSIGECQQGDVAVIGEFFGQASVEEPFEKLAFSVYQGDHSNLVFAEEYVEGFLHIFVLKQNELYIGVRILLTGFSSNQSNIWFSSSEPSLVLT